MYVRILTTWLLSLTNGHRTFVAGMRFQVTIGTSFILLVRVYLFLRSMTGCSLKLALLLSSQVFRDGLQTLLLPPF